MRAARESARASRRDARAEEDGIAIYWLAMFIVVLLGATALTVDLGYRYVVAERVQNAADAAALGGTVFLPTDFSQADLRARDVAGENGFSVSDPNVAITTAPVAGQPTQLKVTIRKTVPVFFAGIFGEKAMTVTRSAIADYDQPVEMGSPSNTFGNQPDCNAPCSSGDATPEMWANVEGPGTQKSKGNAYTSNTCDSSADRCANGVNSDYQPDGMLFTVRNRNPGAIVSIDIFDAVFAHVGDFCDAPPLVALHDAFAGYPNAPRIAPGAWSSTNQYCTGDESTALNQNQPTATTFRVLAPDQTPWTISDNNVVPGCSRTVAGTNDVFNDYGAILEYFRQWATLCSFSAVSGDYILQVQTPSGVGNNNFSIRAHEGASLSSTNQSVFGQGRMAIYANSGSAANTSFYLARVLPGSAGRTLTLDFFDTGDALSGSTGTLQVLPPTDSTAGSSALNVFSNCTYTPPPATGPTPTNSGCTVSGVSASRYQGQWVQWQVPIPTNYSCNYSDPFGCWIRINFRFSGGVQDVTSWRASLGGNPVRIIK